jgi:hypothetical protein
MVLVKRSWSKNSQISEHNDILDIWDTGSHMYERWPNGNEMYWRVVSRDLTETGFTELLEKMPLWQMPAQVLRREQIPLQQLSASQFQVGQWSVEQVTEENSCSTIPFLEEHTMQQGHKSQGHKPRGHMHKIQEHKPRAYIHKTCSPRAQVKGPRQPSREQEVQQKQVQQVLIQSS